MANSFRKLRLLLWKNIILQIRRPIGTAVEVLLPFAFLCLLMLGRKLIEESQECFTSYGQDVAHLSENSIHIAKFMGASEIAYFPINNSRKKDISRRWHQSSATTLMQKVSSNMGLSLINRTESASKEEVLTYAKEENAVLCAIVFTNVKNDGSFGKQVDYDIRFRHSVANRDTWFTKMVYPVYQQIGPNEQSLYRNFVFIQYQVDTAILQYQSGDNTVTAPTMMQQFPYPDYMIDFFIGILRGIFALVFVLCFTYTAVSIVKELVAEKQFRLKESMKMMGLPNWIHWTAWFLKTLLFLLICIILQTILLKAGKIMQFAETGIIFLFLFIYILGTIFFLFCISTLFSQAVRAMVFTAVVWFGSFGPYLAFASAEKFEETSAGAKAGACLLPNSCLGIMITIISQHEETQVGASMSNLNEKSSVDSNFTLGQCFGMLLFDCLFYGLLTWGDKQRFFLTYSLAFVTFYRKKVLHKTLTLKIRYIENVFPGEFGIARPFYFPFQPSYWCGAKAHINNSIEDLNGRSSKDNNFEDEPTGLNVGVSINNLRKEFKGATGKKVAVDGLSLNIYKGQITALLGHNGAGKTTTMSMLTGLFSPTQGEAHVNGLSITSDMDRIRDSLGLCPQHNVLFDRLTVKEHLEFFSALKGVPKSQAKVEIDQMIHDIQLVEKADQKSATLSGGMKRKLNCAIALIGGSETVFLDEPTSGMDPYARRATWDLLQKYRANKTIILTTHFMDEADYLGDRIAIMSHGKVKCCGSSLFLKKRYGVGYHMTLVKGSEFQDNKTRALIAKTIPSSKVVGNAGAELSYILEQESTKHFKGLFEELEDRKDEYGISSFGISVTTLEEVFLKVGEGETVEKAAETFEDNQNDKTNLQMKRTESTMEQNDLLTGLPLKMSQFFAMFMKRFINSKRDKKAVVTQIMIPLLLILCGLLLAFNFTEQEEDPARVLKLDMLKDDSENALQGFFADFSSKSSSKKKLLFDMSKDYMSAVKVEALERTSEIQNIRYTNNGSQINLPYLSTPISTTLDDDQKCCQYKYQVLNEQCRAKLDNIASITKLCDPVKAGFGYGECANDALQGINQTNLNVWYTYYNEYILEVAGQGPKDFFDYKVVGLMSSDSLKTNGLVDHMVYYSNEAWHTKPSALSAGSNILLRYHMNDTDYSITTTNFPLPRNSEEIVDKNETNISILVLVIFCILGIGMLAASFITFVVSEKTSKAKHLQFVSGVDSISYWGATYCWDFLNYLMPAICVLILFAIFNLDDYKGALGEVFLVLILFGLSMLPFIYLASFLFSSALIAYSIIALLLIIMSIAMVLAVFICRATEEDEVADILHKVFLLFPTYALPQALVDLSINVNNRKAASDGFANVGQYKDENLHWDSPGIGIHCLYMWLESVIYFFIVILIEERFFLGAFFGAKNTPLSIKEGEDSDVRIEREKVQVLEPNGIKASALVVKDLTKVYRSNGITAVDHLSVQIPEGECFGLLGINGAGKTTTFGMLTGELGISGGTAYIHGYNIQTQLRKVQQRIGYCPQFDALVEKLTGREMLRMFARLRGIPARLMEDIVSSAIADLNLTEWADKMCGDYSGGNKRKLSTAMALVGNPAVVFLEKGTSQDVDVKNQDEPTSGMDPASRRFLWNTLTSVLNEGRSIVLTSHSMEECEALCTRLVIMVNGQFKCIGSIQHLKSRFGQGYTIMIKISPSQITQQLPPQNNAELNSMTNPSYEASGNETTEVHLETIPDDVADSNGDDSQHKRSNSKKRFSFGSRSSMKMKRQNTISVNYTIPDNSARTKQFIESKFQGAYLIEERQGLLQYQILNPSIRWSQLFGALEENAAELGIVDYSISQTSLEQEKGTSQDVNVKNQVFINFAKLQHSEDRIMNKSCCSSFGC